MKKPLLPIAKLAFTTVAGIGCASLLMAQPSLAQLNTVDSFPGADSNQNNNVDPFSRGGNSDFNMFDLIHRANFGTLNWNSQQQNQQLDEAALEFRKRQQQAIQNAGQQPQVNQSLPITPFPANIPLGQTQPAKN
ncbi:MAG: hypothetical protein KME32_07995 [Mojavia pulchra JT2-VF2]|jgi:hypothetical protein|uniref:Uncharacterized protein n=1 Tax=Mojavia pulchra JT2-VF2 TaxID=287848 RepID=A0A951UFF7_9NOST|nr:hypothetical protein [Mojavia pulchra JT2-VF2]